MKSRSRIDQIGEHFAADTRDHQLVVLHNEGVYRHVTFGRGGWADDSSFAVTTWPHHLAVTGGRGDWVITHKTARDMFELTELDPPDWEDVTDGFAWACFGIAEVCRRYELRRFELGGSR